MKSWVGKGSTCQCRKIIPFSTVILLLILIACKEKNSPPTAKLDVSPLSGDVPLEVRIQLSGVDHDGNDDIKQYTLNVASEFISGSTPIDITRIFSSPGTIAVYGAVTDSENHKDMTSTTSVNVTQGPYIAQSAILDNDVNIKYSATLSKVANAVLTVNKDGVLLFTENISDVVPSGSDFDKIFTYALNGITKGSYNFILKSDNLDSRTSVVVPNYKPTLNLSGVNGNVTECSFVDLILPKPVDKNPEDANAAALIGAKSLDGKTQLTVNGNVLRVRTLPNALDSYQAELEFGSVSGGTDKSILTGIINASTLPIVNPFIQPNDSTLNWYGSGDLTKDNKVDASDLTMLINVINGTYTNPSDIRFLDRADVNGDGIVNILDKDLLEKKLTGIIGYLPGYWNLLMTRGERVDWLTKMMAIDKTDQMPITPDVNCVQFSDQLMINFHGFSNQKDINNFLSVYLYDFTLNGRFNIPVYAVNMGFFDSNGKVTGGHAMNTVVVGDDAFVWNDLCNIEPQFDKINLQPGQYYLSGINSSFEISGGPTTWKLGNTIVQMQGYFAYWIKNNVPSFYSFDYPIKLINQRNK